MFGNFFYNEILRKTVVSFGTLFNNFHCFLIAVKHGESVQKAGPPSAPIGYIVNDDDVQTDSLSRLVIFALALLEQFVFPLFRTILGPSTTGKNVLYKLKTFASEIVNLR